MPLRNVVPGQRTASFGLTVRGYKESLISKSAVIASFQVKQIAAYQKDLSLLFKQSALFQD